MTIQTAAAIVQRLGPCRIAIDSAGQTRLAHELALLGCETVDIGAPSADSRTAGFLAWTSRDTGPSFAHALQPFAAMDALVLQSSGQVRHGIEEALFNAGWQRHPAGLTIGDYGEWTSYALPTLTYYAKASSAPDGPLRRGGADADACIARYAMAANMARPGDTVLIDGADAADGAAILAALSRAGNIRIAATDLSGIADNSIDMIVAFEPPGTGDWIARLDDHARIVKCDGRLVLGWKHGTADGPRNWAMLDEIAGQRFLAESHWRQAAAGRGPGGPRTLHPVPLAECPDSDWLLLVASANPLTGEGRRDDYDHPAFPKAKGPWPELVRFGAAYDNPYLYRAMVQMGERIGEEATLAQLAECIVEDSRPESADRGAALAVLGYRVLEMRQEDLVPAIMPLIAAYVDLPVDDVMPAHVRRWRISLAFLAGRLNELIGERALARVCYRIAAEADWADFSPLLATKSIAASFYEARLCLAEGDTQSALACFHEGLETALKVTACPHEREMGSTDQPLPFYLQELAEVIDMGSQCANAIAHFHLWARDPGLFWRQVDIKRFGLASWARDLERENKRLRGA